MSVYSLRMQLLFDYSICFWSSSLLQCGLIHFYRVKFPATDSAQLSWRIWSRFHSSFNQVTFRYVITREVDWWILSLWTDDMICASIERQGNPKPMYLVLDCTYEWQFSHEWQHPNVSPLPFVQYFGLFSPARFNDDLSKYIRNISISLNAISPSLLDHHGRTDSPDPFVFMSLVVNTSGHLYLDFILLFFLNVHRVVITLTREIPEESYILSPFLLTSPLGLSSHCHVVFVVPSTYPSRPFPRSFPSVLWLSSTSCESIF